MCLQEHVCRGTGIAGISHAVLHSSRYTLSLLGRPEACNRRTRLKPDEQAQEAGHAKQRNRVGQERRILPCMYALLWLILGSRPTASSCNHTAQQALLAPIPVHGCIKKVG